MMNDYGCLVLVTWLICGIQVTACIAATDNQDTKVNTQIDILPLKQRLKETLNMEHKDIADTLNTIEQESFLAATLIASGHETVANILIESAEIKALIDNKAVSLPAVRDRYQGQEAKLADHARLVYFVFFGLAHDALMIDEIKTYLLRNHDLPDSTLLSPWHPYLHGMNAIEKITDGQVIAPDSSNARTQLEAFLAQVTRWEAQHTK